MMVEQFRNAVLSVTLKAIDKEPDSWTTFNDALHTRIIKGAYLSDEVELKSSELPILECRLANSYLLITTERVISILNTVYKEMYINEVEKFLNDYEALNYAKKNGQYPGTNRVAIRRIDGAVLEYIIDSHHAAFFSKILIYNIFSYKTKGYWYLDPAKKK
ncbi:hypothetical protein ACFS6H_13335 [Terrimonas rubra]|uniref:Uncharacterized protein n=1 Tax=Terrimonas rubra TaxID=1035890 RepID=A0ABW6A7U7_9BACT